MRSLSQATNTSEQTKIVQALLTTYEQTLPANSKLSAAQAGRFLTTLQTVQDREIRMPLLKILGHVQTPDSIVAHALGVNLLDNDPELAQLALRSLEKMQLGEESVKNELIPFLSRFAREDRAHGWVGFGGTRDALKGVMTSASLDIDRYFDAMAPTTIAPSVLPTADPSCPRLFTSIAP
jgi:hypothetical protein